MPRPVVILPIRSFTGMTRLEAVLDLPQREALARDLAERVTAAAGTAGFDVLVVSSDDAVARWADGYGFGLCADPGTGLSDAVRAGTQAAGTGPWIAIHADLPLVTAEALERVAAHGGTATVLVPSQDGGTTVIASTGPFPFAYGVGSFRRHLAACPDARVVVSPALSIDIDMPTHLEPFMYLLDDHIRSTRYVIRNA